MTGAVAVALLLAGVAVGGYVIWTLWLTGLRTDHVQDELGRRWARDVGAVPVKPGAVRATPEAAATPEADAALRRTPQPATGDPYAVLWFARPGRLAPPVHAEPLYVVEGVGRDELRAGPGHYPNSDAPGERGNFAVAGHRTTYGAPFRDLDELRAGDLIHVIDQRGRQWTYEVMKHRIVTPGDTWVLGPDPLGVDAGTMTLTTCDPRWSASRRLVVFATLTTTTPV